MGSILKTEHNGRKQDKDIIVVDLTGVAVQDLAIAQAVYKNRRRPVMKWVALLLLGCSGETEKTRLGPDIPEVNVAGTIIQSLDGTPIQTLRFVHPTLSPVI